jgi:hypothetical protein
MQNFIKCYEEKSKHKHLTGMKQFYFLLVAVCISVFSLAQTEGASKIYGYKQKIIPGTIRVDENGRQVQRKPQYNYFIYLASASKVTPVEIWINGEAYTPIVNNVSTTPVEYNHPNGGKPKILVPKTSRTVLQLSPSLNKIQEPSQKGKKLSKKNELVIIYKGSGKLYYKTVSKLEQLDNLAMQ